ncbi:MAG: FAD-dependent oxidoreductase [Pirellula sp.]
MNLRRFALSLFSFAIIAATVDAQEDRPKGGSSVDVIVYGSTPGGVCAAIAAAREGASVILLEPTEHVGGLSTGGLSHCDSNQMRRETLMGLFDEWHTRIVKDYTDRGLPAPYNAAIKDSAKWTFEPHVAMRVTMAMLQEAGVVVRTGCYLKSVTKQGARISSIVTKKGKFQAKVFVDGTYEGDLMAASSVDWTIGREGRDEFGESYAGKQFPKKEMNISGFDQNGSLLPLVTTSDAGPSEAGDMNIMTYSFRLCLTRDPAKSISMPLPTKYDPARFELARRALKAGIRGIGFDLYPLPGDKLDGNNSIGGQISFGLLGACNSWHNADEAGRAKIWEDHKQYTLEFLHFLRTDPAVPADVRSKFADLGLCKDEFGATEHFSPALYVRESRRMKGMYIISQKDILDSPKKDDPIAISSFPIDSHDCQRVALKDGGVVNEGTIFPVRVPGTPVGYAYHVPYRSVLPKPDQCTNLLVPVALSCTHVGISSLRIEGAWMAIGQGAGIAAALSAKRGVDVQELPYPLLRERLISQGQVLELPGVPKKTSTTKEAAVKEADFISWKSLPGIVVDDEDATFVGEWSRSTNFKPSIGSGYRVHGSKNVRNDGKAKATFQVKVPKAGEYQVRVAYSAHETRANNVPVIISSGGRETKFTVDQTKFLPIGDCFQHIGNVELKEDSETTVQIQTVDTAGFVILDAIQFLPLSAAPLTR